MRAESKQKSREKSGIRSFAAAARLAVARAFFDGSARGGEHFARPFAGRFRSAGGADDGFIVFFHKFFEPFAALRANVL